MPTPGKSFSFPGWLAAFGAPYIPAAEIATGGKIFFVSNRSGLPSGNGSTPDYPLSTLDAALAKCQSGRNDTVYVLPGHAETISAADGWASLVAGTKIIGLGNIWGDAPQFTYSATWSDIKINVANVRIQNCRFLMAGALASTTALTVTAAMP